MKKFFIMLVVAIAIGSCATEKKREYRIEKAEDANVMLGKITEAKGPVDFDIFILNPFEELMYPCRTNVSCSCLKMNVEHIGVEPGEYLPVHCSYDPAYREGETTEEAAIIMNGSRILGFRLHADVVPMMHPMNEACPYNLGEGLHTTLKFLNMGDMEPGQTKSVKLKIGNGLDKKAKVEFVPESDWADCISFRSLKKLSANQRDTITFSFTMPERGAETMDTVTFHVQPIVNDVPTENSLLIFATCIEKTE